MFFLALGAGVYQKTLLRSQYSGATRWGPILMAGLTDRPRDESYVHSKPGELDCLIAEYEQSRSDMVREATETGLLDRLEGMTEEEILDYAVEICRQSAE